jgi:transposase
LLCFVVAVLAEVDASSLRDALARALEANQRWERCAAELRAENERLREDNARLVARDAERDAELDRVRADLAVLQRMLFGRSSERSRPTPPDRGDGGGGNGHRGRDRGSGTGVKRGPGARAGRRDYSHLPRFEVLWDFPGGGYCCPECGEPFTLLGDHVSGQQLDWQVIVRVVAHCRRRYRRACGCRVPATVMAPGPPKAIGKGLLSNGFIAMLFTERYVAGRSMNSLVTGLARQGAEVSAATLAGACAQAGALLVPLEEAITARSRDSWHLHADETTWRVFAPREADAGQTGPARWWLWVFIGPDTVCFVMDPTRSGAVLARHAGIEEKTGQLSADADGGPRRLVISSDFYAVYQAAGKKADDLVNLYCWAHVRRHFVRAGDANPAQLKHWTDRCLERIKDLYTAHDELMAAWRDTTAPAPRDAATAAARLDEAHASWDTALTVIDQTRTKQMASPGLQEPAKKALATLEREWDGLVAHRDYPMISLDNNAAERMIRGPVVTRKNAGGSRNEDSARLAATIWTVTATAQMAGLNVLTWLTAYLDECGRHRGKPPTGPALKRFLPWNAGPDDLRAWATPPRKHG